MESNTTTQCHGMRVCSHFVNDEWNPEFPEGGEEEAWSLLRQKVWVSLSTRDSSGDCSFRLRALHKIEEWSILNIYPLNTLYPKCMNGAMVKVPLSSALTDLWDFDFIVLYIYSQQLVLPLFFIKSSSSMFLFKRLLFLL